jgi:hypothetical protein
MINILIFTILIIFSFNSQANATPPPLANGAEHPCGNIEFFKKYQEKSFDIALNPEEVRKIRKAFVENGREGNCIQQAIIEDKYFYSNFKKQYERNNDNDDYIQLSDIIYQPAFLTNYLRGKPEGHSAKIFKTLPENLKVNKSFLKGFLIYHPEIFENIDKKFRGDIDFINTILSSGVRSDKIYPLLSKDIKENRTIALQYLTTSCNLLTSWKEIPENFRNDKYFILDYYTSPTRFNYGCANKNWKTILPLSEELKKDKDFLNKLIHYNPEYQEYLPEEAKKDPEFWVSFVGNDTNNLRKVPFNIRQNEKFAKLLIDRQGFNQHLISNIDKSVFWKVFKDEKYFNLYLSYLQSDKTRPWRSYGDNEPSFNEISIKPKFDLIPREKLEDKNFITRLISVKPDFYPFLDSKIREDRDITDIAIKGNFNNIKFLPNSFASNENYLLDLMLNKSNGLLAVSQYKLIPNFIRNNKNIIKQSIIKKGPARISIASDKLMNSPEFYFEINNIKLRNFLYVAGLYQFGESVKDNDKAAWHSCSLNGDNYKFLSFRLKGNLELAQHCLENLKSTDPLFLSRGFMDSSVASKIASDKNTMMKIFRKSKNHGIFYAAPDEIKNDKEFIMQALEYVPDLIDIIPYNIRNDKKLYLKAVSKYGMTLNAAPEFMRDDFELVKTAVTSSPAALQYASERLKDDKEIVLIAARRDRDVLRYASDRMKKVFNYSKDEEDREFINDESLKMYIIDIDADKPTDWNRVNKIFEK